jgi:transposase
MLRMLGTRAVPPIDPQGMPPHALELFEQMRQRIEQQQAVIDAKDREIALREAKLEKVQFELARLKRWKFGAKTEAMSAEQRQLFQETLAEDEASLLAQLADLQTAANAQENKTRTAPRQPRRQALPEHLRRIEHHHEPEDTTCPSQGCGQAMTRVGEDITEKLDILPAEFFVHRHIYGKWCCRACQLLKQQPAAADVIDGGIPAAGLVAHTLISRFVDHLPYYRQEAINARSGVHTPRSTLAAWAGQAGAALEPLYETHKRFVLQARVLHADETPVALLDPGAGKTRRAYVWAYARSELDDKAGVIFEFCAGRGAQYPRAFLAPTGQPPWQGTLLTDQYAGYDAVLDARVHPGRTAAGCVAHARRKFDELAKSGASLLAPEAIRRFAEIYRIEAQLKDLPAVQRQQQRYELAKPRWDELGQWLRLERARVPDGGPTAAAIDYALNHWVQLTRHLDDGDVAIDNNFLERQIKPWQMGRKNWLFAGSELAGQRAAIVMSLLQSAKLNGHEPWAYLRDVLTRLPTQLNSRIEELLPHRWQAAAA